MSRVGNFTHDGDDQDGRDLPTELGWYRLVMGGGFSVVGSVWCNDHRAHKKRDNT